MDRDAARARADEYLTESASVTRAAATACVDSILDAAASITACFRAGGTLLICGNGGSAADSQHLATEFVSTLRIDHPRPAMRAMALTTDTSILTAISNDFDPVDVFARQVEALGRSGDILLCISTSGTSPNVLRAAERATTLGMVVVALSGETGGALAASAKVAIRIPSLVGTHVQETHLAIEHLLAFLTERDLYPTPVPPSG